MFKANSRDQWYDAIKAVLHCSSPPAPESLVENRPDEYQVISNLCRKGRGSLYIAGKPGTGKSALVDQVVRETKPNVFDQIINLNCMALSLQEGYVHKERTLIKLLVDRLDPDSKQARPEARHLETLIWAPLGKRWLLVLDEFDQLVGCKETSLALKLFRWGAHPQSNFAAIGISNSMDLFSGMDDHAVSVCIFQPYTLDQVVDILAKRVSTVPNSHKENRGFHPLVFELCARKTLGVGDLRMTLDLIRQVVEVAQSETSHSDCLVDLVHAQKVLCDTFSKPFLIGTAVQDLNIHHQLVILALAAQTLTTNSFGFEFVYQQYRKNCQMSALKISPLPKTQILDLVYLLEGKGILAVRDSRGTRSFGRNTINLGSRLTLHLRISGDEYLESIQQWPHLTSLYWTIQASLVQ